MDSAAWSSQCPVETGPSPLPALLRHLPGKHFKHYIGITYLYLLNDVTFMSAFLKCHNAVIIHVCTMYTMYEFFKAILHQWTP